MIASARSYLIPEDFDYLRRGGRLTPLAATFAHLVKAFPVMQQTEDGTRLEKLKVARSFAKAVDAVANDLEEHGVGEGSFIGISHADNLVQAIEAKDRLAERFPACRFGVFELGPAFITQGGPGCLAVQAVDLGPCPDLSLA
ncbi:MAG: DegV family protein [Eggerthellaceae bacterium]